MGDAATASVILVNLKVSVYQGCAKSVADSSLAVEDCLSSWGVRWFALISNGRLGKLGGVGGTPAYIYLQYERVRFHDNSNKAIVSSLCTYIVCRHNTSIWQNSSRRIHLLKMFMKLDQVGN